jgi:hypothetical protein
LKHHYKAFRSAAPDQASAKIGKPSRYSLKGKKSPAKHAVADKLEFTQLGDQMISGIKGGYQYLYRLVVKRTARGHGREELPNRSTVLVRPEKTKRLLDPAAQQGAVSFTRENPPSLSPEAQSHLAAVKARAAARRAKREEEGAEATELQDYVPIRSKRGKIASLSSRRGKLIGS